MLLGETIDHLAHRFRTAGDFSNEVRFPASPAFGERNRNRLLVRIHRHIGRRRLFHGSFPLHEALADSSANPRCCMARNEPP
jgi:hypothetical protein